MVRIYDDAFPFVIAVVGGSVTDDDIATMYAAYAPLHERGRRFYLAQEVRQVDLPDAVMRKKLADLNNEYADRAAKNVIGVGLVISSRLASAALTAIYWASGEKSPTRFFSLAKELVAHAKKSAAAESVILPPRADSIASALDDAFAAKRPLIDVNLR